MKNEDKYDLQLDGMHIPISINKFWLFYKLSFNKENKKRGYNISWDANLLYQLLICSGIKQATNSVWANNAYLAKGLNISKQRISAAKKLLYQIGLIKYQLEQQIEKDIKGHFQKQYITVLTDIPLSRSMLNGSPVNRSTVKPLAAQNTTNALSNKINALSNKINALENVQEAPLHTSILQISKKNIFGEFQNVFLMAEEYNKLLNRFGDTTINKYIESLSCYLAQKNKKYKSHYATLLNWMRKDNIKPKEYNNFSYKNYAPLD